MSGRWFDTSRDRAPKGSSKFASTPRFIPGIDARGEPGSTITLADTYRVMFAEAKRLNKELPAPRQFLEEVRGYVVSTGTPLRTKLSTNTYYTFFGTPIRNILEEAGFEDAEIKQVHKRIYGLPLY